MPFSRVCWCAAVSTDWLCARRLQAFDDFLTAAAGSFTLTVNDEEKPQIEQSSCPTAVVATKGLPPWPELAAVDNSGDEVDIKALVTSRTRDGMVITEVTAESALTGAHAYTFRGASADRPVCRAVLLCSDMPCVCLRSGGLERKCRRVQRPDRAVVRSVQKNVNIVQTWTLV